MGVSSMLFPRDERGRKRSGWLYALGLRELCQRSSRSSYFVPPTVPIELDGAVPFKMSSANATDHIVREIWMHGVEHYEPPLPRVYAVLAQGATQVLDVGANSGLYALLAAACSKDARVFAFEPFPQAVACLRANIALNSFAKGIEVVEAAAGDARGSFKLYVPEKTHGETLETSCSLESTFRSKHDSVLDVQVIPLDAFTSDRGLKQVSLLRADVEGAEYRVIAGAQRVLREQRPFVLVEVLSTEAASKLAPFPAACDYICYSMHDALMTPMQGVQFVAQQTNHLWCPRERTEELRAKLASIGMRVSDAAQPV